MFLTLEVTLTIRTDLCAARLVLAVLPKERWNTDLLIPTLCIVFYLMLHLISHAIIFNGDSDGLNDHLSDEFVLSQNISQ